MARAADCDGPLSVRGGAGATLALSPAWGCAAGGVWRVVRASQTGRLPAQGRPLVRVGRANCLSGPSYWKYPFTSRTKCTAPADPFFTLIVPKFVASRMIALLARVTPAPKLMLLVSGASVTSPR